MSLLQRLPERQKASPDGANSMYGRPTIMSGWELHGMIFLGSRGLTNACVCRAIHKCCSVVYYITTAGNEGQEMQQHGNDICLPAREACGDFFGNWGGNLPIRVKKSRENVPGSGGPDPRKKIAKANPPPGPPSARPPLRCLLRQLFLHRRRRRRKALRHTATQALLVKCAASEDARIVARMQPGRPCHVAHAVSADRCPSAV